MANGNYVRNKKQDIASFIISWCLGKTFLFVNLLQILMQDPLLQARKAISLYSLSRAYHRLQKQQNQVAHFDETQLDEQLDLLVHANSHFQSICTEYGDSSSVTRGRFSKEGGLYGCVGASGEGKIWATREEGSMEFGKLLTEIKEVNKLCDIDFHPQIGQIPKFAPNILTGSVIGQVNLWTFDPTLPVQKSIKIKAHTDRVNNVKFHSNCSVFLSASYDKSWSIWDAKTLKQLSNQKGHSKEIHSLSIHPDGSLILTGDLGGDGMIWDLRTGKGVYDFSISSSIVCSSFHPNGSQFAVGGKNNTIQIFDLRRKKQFKTIPAHIKLISDLTYSADGSMLLSGSHDMNVKLWHGRTYGSVGQSLQHPAKISSIDYVDGKLGVSMLDRKIILWGNGKQRRQTKMQEL